MYHTCNPFWLHVRLLLGFSLTMNLVPGGSKGVLLNSKLPSIILRSGILGLRIEGLSMLNVILLDLGVCTIGALVTSC